MTHSEFVCIATAHVLARVLTESGYELAGMVNWSKSVTIDEIERIADALHVRGHLNAGEITADVYRTCLRNAHDQFVKADNEPSARELIRILRPAIALAKGEMPDAVQD